MLKRVQHDKTMLREIHIKNFAIIDEITVEFAEGLNIFSGETGAGKSIIIDALNLVLGERGFTEQIRTGADASVIEAIFDVEAGRDLLLRNKGIDIDDSNILILKRELNKSGKNKCYINSSPVPLNTLYEIGVQLVDIHGQHEHKALLKSETHIEFLDNFAVLTNKVTEIKELFLKLNTLKTKKENLTIDEHEKTRKIDLLSFQINEIEDANLKAGEEEELKSEKTILMNAQKIFNLADESYSKLKGEGVNVLNETNKIINILKEISAMDAKISSCVDVCEKAKADLDEVGYFLREYKTKIIADDKRLEEVEDRLDLVGKLKRKYGDNFDAILVYKEKIKEELNSIIKSDEEIKKIDEEIIKGQGELVKLSLEVSKMREKASKSLQEKVVAELKNLGMENINFSVCISHIEENNPPIPPCQGGDKYKVFENGMDIVEFLISPNPGEELKPLSKIASGGEISRVMLALKVVLAKVDKVPVMVFDEVDSGIGGRIAEAVGKKLKVVSKNYQVICITHLHQIAGFADIHFKVWKETSNKRTKVLAEKLDNKGQVEELARMIAGEKITDSAIKHAQELLYSCRVKQTK